MDIDNRFARIERVALRVAALVFLLLTLIALVIDKFIWAVKTISQAISSVI